MDPRPVVLVTGSAQRIGRAIALELAAAGWRVAVHHRRSAAEAAQTVSAIAAAGSQALAFVADLAQEDAAEALVPAVAQAFGRIDAVVNNASLFEHDTIDTLRWDVLERHWRANTAAPLVLARALHRAAAAPGAPAAPAGGRAVVNLLDQKLWNPNPDHLSYTLSKAALESANTLLALALAPAVRVVGVAPGVTLLSGDMSDPEFEASHRMTPLGRSSTPADVARAVRFALESPAITGTTLLVDGGQHLSPQRRDVMFLARGSA
ncbi:MAG: SDR family oxidoreductase [Pseudomonadota bacterium]|jgi:NAD(P)-dependent dehydrogenase (short-subunit alcohol dehydrogenase family)|nr:SDR family oxidoreductase [Rubrivivax sp.]MCA3259108.1 SDR family oxidoreductase [Rubrivivax sp.]MCZ8029598.1 SDR family oxidoreductase [Rubrivivax sp.]